MEQKNSKKPAYKYYSEVLKQVFDTPEALEAAEALKAKQTSEKSVRAKAVEESYAAIRAVMTEYNAKLEAAEDTYLKLRNDFVRDYGSFHMTYSTKELPAINSYQSLLDWIKDFFN